MSFCTDHSNQGFFHCRLTAHSDVEGLGILVRQFAAAGHMPYFLITEMHPNSAFTQEITIDDSTLNRMIHSRGLSPAFRMREVTIRASNKAAKTLVSLCFTKGTSFPLSGFPRCLHNQPADPPISSGAIMFKTAGSIRWASRTRSQRQRRFDWTPPSLAPSQEIDDVLTRYSDGGHLLRKGPSLGSTTEAVDTPVSSMDARIELVTGSSISAQELGAPALRVDVPAQELRDRTSRQFHELPVVEMVHELPGDSAQPVPVLWMADEDWKPPESPIPERTYMRIRCGEVLEVRSVHENSMGDSWWWVLRRSDRREGLVPSRCLQPLKATGGRSPATDASPVDGSGWYGVRSPC